MKKILIFVTIVFGMLLINITFSQLQVDTKVLIEQLKDEDWTIRKKAVEVLGESKDVSLVDILIEMLDDEHPVVRFKTIDALVKIHDKKAIPSLIKVLNDSNLNNQRLSGGIKNIEALDSLLSEIKIKDSEIKWKGVEVLVLGKKGGNTAIETLITRLQDENSNVRRESAYVLGKIKDNRAVEPLNKILNDGSENVRLEAIIALRNIGDIRSIKPLILLLGDRNSDIRREVKTNIIKMGASSIDPLIEKLDDDKLRDKVIESLILVGNYNAEPLIKKLIGNSKTVEPLILLLTDKNSEISAKAKTAIIKIGKPAIDPLIEKLYDDKLRDKVIKSLVLIGMSTAKPLIKKLNDKNYRIREAAADILIEIKYKSNNYTENSLILIAKIKWNEFRKGMGEAVPLLIKVLYDENEDIRIGAIVALGEIRDSRAVDPLLAIYIKSGYKEASDALGKIGLGAFEPILGAVCGERLDHYKASDIIVKMGEQAVKPLIALFDIELNFFNRRFNKRLVAAISLGKIGDNRAIEPLLVIVKNILNENQLISLEAANALEKLGWLPESIEEKSLYYVAKREWDNFASLGEPAVNVLVNKFKNAIKQRNRDVLIDTLSKIGRPIVEILIDSIELNSFKDNDKAERIGLLETLGKIGDRRAINLLIDLFEDNNSNYSYDALEALCNIKDNRAKEFLLSKINDRDPKIRNVITKYLGAENDQIDQLIVKIKDDVYSVRSNACESLIKIGAPAVKKLITALEDNNWLTLNNAVWVLSQMKGKDNSAIKPFYDELKDREIQLNLKVVCDLGGIKNVEDIQSLIDKLKDLNNVPAKLDVETLIELKWITFKNDALRGNYDKFKWNWNIFIGRGDLNAEKNKHINNSDNIDNLTVREIMINTLEEIGKIQKASEPSLEELIRKLQYIDRGHGRDRGTQMAKLRDLISRRETINALSKIGNEQAKIALIRALKIEGDVQIENKLRCVLGKMSEPLIDPEGATAEMVIQKGHSGNISDIAFSPDGKYIASSSLDNTIKLWEIDGKLVKNFISKEPVNSISFSYDSKHIVSSGNNIIQLWNIYIGIYETISNFYKSKNIYYNMKPIFSPDGKYIAFGTENNTLELYNFEGNFRGNTIKTFEGHSDAITSASFSHDGKQIATVSRDKTIKLWDNNGKLTRTFETDPTDGGYVDSIIIQFSPDGKYICSKIKSKEDNSIKLWSTDGRLIRTFKKHDTDNLIDSMSFSSDGKYIAFSCQNKIEILTIDGELVRTIEPNIPLEGASYVSFSPDGKYIAHANSVNKVISLWSFEGELIRFYGREFSSISSVSFSPDGSYIVAAHGPVIKLWSIDGKLIKTFNGHNYIVDNVIFSSDKKYIISGASDGIKIWDVNSESVRTLTSNYIKNSLAISPDGRYIVAGTGKKAELWSFDGEHIRDFEGNINAVTFSPDGKYIISGSEDKIIKQWNLDGTSIELFKTDGAIKYLTFSPDGKYIISNAVSKNKIGYSDKVLIKANGEYYLRKNNEYYKRWLSSLGVDNQIQFSPDSKHFAYIDGTNILICRNDMDSFFKTFAGHNSSVNCVSFSPDSKLLITGSSDGTIKIWEIGDINASNQLKDCVTLISPENSDDWIMYTSDGYFDASKDGGELVAMLKDMTISSIDQFAIKNNRPDIILNRRLGLKNKILIKHYYQQYKKRLRKIGIYEEKLSSDYHVPLTEITESKQNGKFLILSFKLSDNKYNLKNYNIYLNDVPIYGSYGKEITGNNIDKTDKVELISGKNKIEVTCINEAGGESFRALTYADYKEDVKGNLYYIGFGVSNYKNSDLNLKYAHKDVLDLGNVLSKMDSGFNNIYAKTYINEEVTVENIIKAKELLNNAKVDDTFVLFIAGHGLHDTDEEETYYFLTYETELKDLKKTAANFELVEYILQGINPRKKIFLIDACESGEIEEETQDQYYAVADSRGLKARATRRIKIEAGDIKPAPRTYLLEQDRFIYNDLMRRSGAIVFSSSRGGEFSYEKDDIQNGLFTESIINSLTSKDSDKNNDGIISTDELREYVINAVQKTSNNLQHPTVDRDNIYQKFGFQIVE